MTATQSLFATKLYRADLAAGIDLAALAHSIRALAEDDGAGARWSREHGYRGYTSYASLADLPRRDRRSPTSPGCSRVMPPVSPRIARSTRCAS